MSLRGIALFMCLTNFLPTRVLEEGLLAGLQVEEGEVVVEVELFLEQLVLASSECGSGPLAFAKRRSKSKNKSTLSLPRGRS
jgi:hypothetical protein